MAAIAAWQEMRVPLGAKRPGAARDPLSDDQLRYEVTGRQQGQRQQSQERKGYQHRQ